METIENQKWSNWSGTSESIPEKWFYPATIEEVASIVRSALIAQRKIRVVGAGHSFTKLAHTDEWLISLDRLSGIIEIDETNMEVTVLAGTRLHQLGKVLGEKGYAQENLGDINVQSVAGAVSTGTHGTGLAFGNISSQVKELVVVTATGDLLTISKTENSHLYEASLVSLGMLGIIVQLTLAIIPSPVYEYKSEKCTFHQLEEQFLDLIDNHRHFECYLFPYSDIVQLKTMNITSQKPQSLRIHHFKNLILENYLFYLISETCRMMPSTSPFFSKLSAKAVGTDKVSSFSYNLFATPRLVRFREMEYCIPLEHALAALNDIRDAIEKNHYHVHFPIECRSVKKDDSWLSPSFERDSFYIAFHMYKGMDHHRYFNDMETIMAKYGGRPHWGKMHTRSSADLQHMYPKYSDFLAIRDQLDPAGIFMNEYLSSLFPAQTEKIEMDNIGML
ncbi:D-arabinono-1,4-lactone oxidase [Bacillus sp. 1P06AnD]|uniref:D-arabinono-1,4-lactone oxidase n=1 Tax=Bacillus sp. 1P06AnD TaxID=3132208 RepID=UPI0039A314D5